MAVVPAGPDRLLLTSADVRRITPDDRTIWVTPFESPERPAHGRILKAPGGDVLAILYCGIANSGVQVMRFDPVSGEARWRTWCDPLSDVTHLRYSHEADLELAGDRVRVISSGDAGKFVERIDVRTGSRERRGERRR